MIAEVDGVVMVAGLAVVEKQQHLEANCAIAQLPPSTDLARQCDFDH